MKLSNEQINKLAADVLGVEYCNGRVAAAYDSDFVCLVCDRHMRHDIHSDFCTDLNAAQRLVKHVFNTHIAENIKSNRFAYVIFDVLSIEAISLHYNPNLDNRDLVTLYRDVTAKTITLAALVAAGKITVEDARESLEDARDV